MKKILTSIITVIMCLSMVCPVLASTFVPSITYKPAPELVVKPGNDGEDIIGEVVDKNGNVVGHQHGKDCIIIVPVADAKEDDLIKKLYNQIVSGEVDVNDFFPDGKYVIKDMFDMRTECEDLLEYLPGNKIELTFDTNFKPDTDVKVMVYVDGQWVELEGVVINKDGTLTCTFEHLGPVMFLVPEDFETPTTGDANNSQVLLWSAVAGISLIAMVLVAVVYRRRMSK